MVTGYVNTNVKNEVKKPTQFAMIKNVQGALAVGLEAHDFSTPKRVFHFKFNQDRKYVPVKWALGTFVTDSALRQMQLGFFTFENLQELIEMAEEAGYYVPDSIKDPKIAIKDIRKMLKDNDVDKLKTITLNISRKVRNDLITTAKSMHDRLNNQTIKFLEKELNISLQAVDLDA